MRFCAAAEGASITVKHEEEKKDCAKKSASQGEIHGEADKKALKCKREKTELSLWTI